MTNDKHRVKEAIAAKLRIPYQKDCSLTTEDFRRANIQTMVDREAMVEYPYKLIDYTNYDPHNALSLAAYIMRCQAKANRPRKTRKRKAKPTVPPNSSESTT